MPVADPRTYLADLVALLKAHWPEGRTVTVACHGHSVPAGYFATPMVDTFNAYPHLLHRGLKARFPFAMVNVVVTAIGGENSRSGAERFERDVLGHRTDVVTIDYALNDRGIGPQPARAAWGRMVELAQQQGVRTVLLTPTPDVTRRRGYGGADADLLSRHAEQVRELAAERGVGLADSFAAFRAYCTGDGELDDLLSWSNHPNRGGHELVARELLRWFPVA
jgi:lysophospholipase L1-like esterase